MQHAEKFLQILNYQIQVELLRRAAIFLNVHNWEFSWSDQLIESSKQNKYNYSYLLFAGKLSVNGTENNEALFTKAPIKY